jgi:uncharacterized protein
MADRSWRVWVGVAAGTLLAAQVAGAEDRWIEVKSPHFTVATNGREPDARAAARKFEQIRAVFDTLAPNLSQSADRPILILGARDEGTMKALLPHFWEQKGGVRPQGLFFPGTGQVFMALRLDMEGQSDDESTVLHEYMHSLVERHFDTVPLWLNEGFADFYGNSSVESERVLVGRASRANLGVLREAPLLPLETLLGVNASSPHYNEQSRATIFYAQSWGLVHYLVLGEKGIHRPLLQAYLLQLARGVEPVEAGRQAFGDLKAFERKLYSYIRGFQFFMQPVPTPGAPPARDYTVRTIPSAEVLAIHADFHAASGRLKEARAEGEQAVRLDPQLSRGWLALATVHSREGRGEEARRAAAEAIRTDPRSPLAHYTLGTLARDAGDWAAAEAALARAVELKAGFAGAYVFLAEARTALGRPNEDVLPLVQRALELEPGSSFIQFLLSSVLRDRGDFAGARALGERALRMTRSPQERASVQKALDKMSRRVPSDPMAALRHHEAACDAGTGDSCADLAEAAHHGRGMAQDLARARALYDKACAAKAEGACQELAVLLAKGEGGAVDATRAAALLAPECEAGSAYSCMYLGWMRASGQGLAKDPAAGAVLYAKACEGGNSDGCRLLGRLHADGAGVAKDEARAFALFEKACAAGDVSGCGSVGHALRRGLGVAKDAGRALEHLTRACDGGQEYFCSGLGYMYETGDGVAKDPARAFALHMKGCEKADDSWACQGAGILLHKGLGVSKDPAKAVILLGRACEEQNGYGCYYLAWMHEGGEGVPANPGLAKTLYRKACDGGEADGCAALARLDPAAGRAGLQKACDAKDAVSCGQLGILFMSGRSVAADYGKAARLFTAGCDGGDAASCSNLGALYHMGQGVPQDIKKSDALFAKACAGGYQAACSQRKPRD